MIYVIIPVLLIFIIATFYDWKGTKLLIDEEDMKKTYIFKHPCGGIVVNDKGNPILFEESDAVEYANKHPYRYVKNCFDNEYHFAYTYFNLNESKTIQMKLLDKALATNGYYLDAEQKKKRVLEIEELLKKRTMLKPERDALKRERVQLLTDILQAWRVKKHALKHTKP